MNVHTPKSQRGSGDYYGTGIKQKVGRVREDFMVGKPKSPESLGKPPRKLA
jgi:hypothetical protein